MMLVNFLVCILSCFYPVNPKQENGGVSDVHSPPKQGFDNLGFVPGSPCELCPQNRDLCCGSVGTTTKRESETQMPPVQSALVSIRVEGMTCQSCVQSIEGHVSQLPGVIAVQISLSDKEAAVTFNPGQLGPEELRTYIEDMGFDAIIISHPISPSVLPRKVAEDSVPGEVAITLGVDGMHSRSCVNNIQEHVSGLMGVCSVSVSLESRSMDLKYDSSLLAVETVKELVEGIPPGHFRVTLPVGRPVEIGSTGPTETTHSSQHPNSALTHQTTDSVAFQTATIRISGMTCNSCVQSIEGMISQRPGVQSIRVSLKEEKGIVSFNPTLTSAEELTASIEDMGFEAKLDKGIDST